MKLSRRAAAIAIALTIVLQLGIASSTAVRAWYIEKSGAEIVLVARAYDPRSMFRGNYARVNYDISSIDATKLPENFDAGKGAPLYVLLKPGKDGRYHFDSAYAKFPEEAGTGVVLRGRARRGCRSAALQASSAKQRNCNVRYGIEAYFAPKDKALMLEQALREHGADAVVRVGASGQAILVSLDPQDGD